MRRSQQRLWPPFRLEQRRLRGCRLLSQPRRPTVRRTRYRVEAYRTADCASEVFAHRHAFVVLEELVAALLTIGDKAGRRRRWPDNLHADNTYAIDRCRHCLRQRGIQCADRPQRNRAQQPVGLLSLERRAHPRLVCRDGQVAHPL